MPPNDPSNPTKYFYLDDSGQISDSTKFWQTISTGVPSLGKKKIEQSEFWYNRKITELIPKIPRKKSLIGLEIEMEGENLFRNPIKYWKMDVDGSLRDVNGHPPAEYVLKKPLNHEDTKEALKYLEYQLKVSNANIVISHRCSIHVHLNVQQWTLRKVYCLILLYIIFEDILVQWSGPTRVGNCFCLRVKDSDYIVEMLQHNLKNESFLLWNENMRYGAINVNSIMKFGSLEFRSLRGTNDFKVINQWIVLLLRLREMSMLYDNPIEILTDFLEKGPTKFYDKIWGSMPYKGILGYQPNIQTSLWEGFRIARDIGHSIEWKPYINKKKVEETEEVVEEEFLDTPSLVLSPHIKVYYGDKIQTKWGMRMIRSRDYGEFVVRFYDWSTGDYSSVEEEVCLQERETMYFFEQDDKWIVVDIRTEDED